MSIASEITRINTNIANSYTAVDNKGGTLPATQNSANLASAIDSIEVIEQVTAEGESLSLANTKAMPYNDYVVEGKSEQETGKSKNLFDYNQIISNASRTIENGGFVINNTDFQSGSLIGILKNLCPNLKVGDKFKFNWDTNATRGNSDVTYIYLSSYANTIRKDITYTCTQEMLDSETYFYGQQGQYYKNIMFYLEGQTSDYEPYGEKPSPSNPSEIHSVADDVNLFDASKIANSSISVTDNGKTIKLPIASSGNGNVNTNTFLKDLCPELNVGDVVYLNFTRNINPGKNNFIFLYNNTMSPPAVEWDNRTPKTITQDLLDSYMILYGNKAQDGETQQIIIIDFKIQKNKITPYSPYNQGTVTIKQRGKNLLDIKNYSKSGYNVTVTNPLKGLIAGDYTISCQNKHTAGSAIIFSNEINGSQIGGYFTGYDFGRTLTSKTRALTQEQLNAKYMIFQGQDSSITQEVLENMQIQIEKGSTATSYEPYQANDFTFQTEPLRSLPNGVKDSKESDGNHRRVGRYILPEITALSSGTALGTQCQYATYSLSNSKTGGRNYNFISNIIAPANDIYGQYKGYRNSTNIVVMTSTDDTVENFNSKISGSEVLYELEEETIEPFTQNQATTMLDIIKTGSYEGTTNIYTDEDVKPTIEVEYYKKG